MGGEHSQQVVKEFISSKREYDQQEELRHRKAKARDHQPNKSHNTDANGNLSDSGEKILII